MAADPITADQMEKLLAEHAKAVGNTIRTNVPSGTPSQAAQFGGVIGSQFTAATNGLGSVLNPLTGSFGNIKNVVDQSMGTWRDLSASGANFNNDIIGMNVAAAGSRVSLDEFANTIKQNSINLTGLGGSVGQGALQFAKMSKEMAEGNKGYTETLRIMGYNSKEVNDVLALQVSTQRASANMDKDARTNSIDAAARLATEMDMLAKLTGVSRAEQMETMRKAATDGKVEAKFRLMEAEDRRNGTNNAEIARANYLAEQNKAAQVGMGQAYKEIFLFGRVTSQEAANQVAVTGELGRATANSAKALAAGDLEAAKKFNEQAQVAAIEYGRNENTLRMVLATDQNNKVGDINNKIIEKNLGLDAALAAIRKDEAMAGLTGEQQLAEAKLRVARQQAGQDPRTGEAVAGAATTKALVQMQGRLADANSAIMTGLVQPLNDRAYKAVQTFSSSLDNMTHGRTGGDIAYAKALEEKFKSGFMGTDKGVKPANEPATMANVPTRAGGLKEEGFMGAGVAGAIGSLTGTIARATFTGIEHLNIDGIKKYAEGGVVDKPELAIVGDAGKEHVIPDAKLQTLMANIKAQGMEAGMAKVSKTDAVQIPDMASTMTEGISSLTKGFKFESIETGLTKVLEQMSKILPKEEGTRTPEPSPVSEPVSLKDVLDALDRLNNTMGSMAAHTESISDHSSKQVRATKSLSNNRFA